MKRNVLALTVLVAATAGANAQSSVTLFGIVDTTLAFGKGSVANRTQLAHSGNAATRIGFRGTEDLGGGMSASFWLEAGINTDNGSGAATNVNNQTTGGAMPALGGGQGLTFNRRSTVSLSSRLGELRLGRDYTSTFWNLVVFDPFGYNGVGNTVLAATGLGTATVQVRASNSIGYFLPGNMGGFYGQAQYFLGENLKNGAPTEKDGTGANFRIGWAGGPVNVAVAHGRTDFAAGDLSTTNVGGQYDFGIARVMGTYLREHVDAPARVNGRGGLIGAVVPVGGSGEVRVSYSTYRVQAATSPRSSKVAIGYVHNLSKRSALYTTYARAKNSGGATLALNGSTTAANGSSSGVDFGFRHAF
jgi:predicted porin